MRIGFEISGLIMTPTKSLTDLGDISEQKVIEGAKDVIVELKKQGHIIIIYTKLDVSTALTVERWLDKNKIPYDQITFNRPNSNTIYFSENTRKFTNWESVISELREIGAWKDPIVTQESMSTKTTDGVQKLKNDI